MGEDGENNNLPQNNGENNSNPKPPQLPGPIKPGGIGPGGGIPGVSSGGSGLNPIKQKEVDIMDPEDKGKSTQKKGIGDTVQDVKEKVEGAKKVIDTISKVVSTLGPWGCLIVLIIIIIIGLWGFLHYMPGLAIGKIKEFAEAASDFVQSFFIPEAMVDIKDEDINNLANYLEEMEYDLVGYGFVTPVLSLTDSIPTIEDLREQGYTRYANLEGDGYFRYYNEAGEMYNGKYYNAVGIPINNSTGQIVSNTEYTDKYGIKRSSEEIASSGEGKITGFTMKRQNNLLKSYLLSDARIYTLRNDDQGILNKIYAALAKTFGGFDGAWAKGLIKLYTAKDGIAEKSWGFWNEFLWKNDISISPQTKTLDIRKGWFNNKTSFKIEGWAARYGLSLEFLLSLHIGTMAPDLVNAMLQNFDTEVQVYLQDSGAGSVECVYVDPDAPSAAKSPDYGISLKDIKDKIAEAPGLFAGVQSWAVNSGAMTDWVNSLAITKTKALWLLKKTELVSPANCTGSAQAYVIEKSTYETSSFLWMDTSENALIHYGITEAKDPDVYTITSSYQNYEFKDEDGNDLTFTAEHCTHEIGTDNEDYKSDTYTRFWPTDCGYNDAEAEKDQIDKITFNTERMTGVVDYGYGMSGMYYGDVYEVERVKQRRTWSAVVGEGDDAEEVDYEWIAYKYLVYKTGTYTQVYDYAVSQQQEKTITPLDEEEWVDTIVFEYVIRDKNTAELKEAGIIDEEGNYVGTDKTLCSENPDLEAGEDKCCKACLEYVESVVMGLARVEDKDYSTYTPYIARVVGSWFRDTYFVIPKEADLAINEYMNGKDKSSKPIEGSQDSNDDGYVSEDERNNVTAKYRSVYLPGHHDSSLYDAYGSGGEVKLNLVTVDSEYLEDTGEYWTSYELNANGEYQLYYLEPDGNISDMTLEQFLANNSQYASRKEAEEDGNAFVKKPNTIKATDLENPGSTNDKILWIAYGFDTNGAETGWQQVTAEDGNAAVSKVYSIKDPGDDAGFFYNILTTNTVSQIEDAQRAETNRTIKQLFKYRKFYIYDGTEETALSIQRDKENVINNYVKPLLENTYGSGWPSTIAQNLGKHGRSALQQAYGNTFVFRYRFELDCPWVGEDLKQEINEQLDAIQNFTDDAAGINTIVEQWYDWQLDMFYAVKDGKGNNVYRNNGYLIIPEDYRNPDLIATVNINKTSLNAFAILENTQTLDAEYQYRDFKELIVELDYFDKEDLSDKLDSVFTWVLPEISPSGWPVRPWDKQNNEYGALIQSKETYSKLKANTTSGSEDNTTSETETAPETEETSSEETDVANTESAIKENKIFFVGDSWIAGLRDAGIAETNYFDGRNGASGTTFLSSMPTVPNDASCIVVCLGMNLPTTYNKTQEFINKLILENPGIPVVVLKTSHVASGYSSGSVTASQYNTQIDEHNQKMQEFCSTTENCTFVDPTRNINENNGSGYLKDEYKSNEYHLNSSGAQKWYEDIIAGINNANPDAAAGSTLSVFEGYEKDNMVASPVTGRIIEWGTHSRVNIYTEEPEDVEYVVIEVMNSDGSGTDGYFTDEMLSNTSNDTEDLYVEDAKKGLNYFYEEYEDVCEGYLVMIDGFDFDLAAQDEEGNNGSYEQNPVRALYNTAEESRIKIKEQMKDDAPFFINYGETDIELGNSDSVPATYIADLNETKGYYVKEGKYLGKTITSSSTTTDDTPDTSTDTPDAENETTTPTISNGDYMRIMVKDLDNSIVDNVEEFFDIEEYGRKGSGIYGDLEAINESSTDAEKVRAAMSYFINEQGYTPEAAAGIVGNLIVESGLDPAIVSSSGYHGLAQWNTSDGGGHWWDAPDGIRNWLLEQGYNEDSFAGQIRAICEAPRRGQMGDRWEELKVMTNIEQAAELFCVYYEACPGGSDPTVWYLPGTNYQGLAARKQCAKNAYDIYMGDDSKGIKDGI